MRWTRQGSGPIVTRLLKQLFDKDNKLVGYIIFQETVKLSSDGNSYAGSGTYQMQDMDGEQFDSGTLTTKATRITAS